MLQLATKRAADAKCRFVLNDAPNLPLLDDRSFDLVYSRLVLQHIPPEFVRNYLREFVRVTKSGGVITFQLPTPSLERPPQSLLARSLPGAVLPLARRMKRRLEQSIQPHSASYMDDYGLTSEETISIISSCGGGILRIEADGSHGSNRPGFKYWVTIA